jgi:hypothetical protein
MTEIARLPPADFLQLAFGDTDHDGRVEVFSTWRDSKFNFSYRVYEELTCSPKSEPGTMRV